MSKENTKRIPYFDNVKGLLITLVVLGHIIEPFLYIHSLDFIYILIYSFHMPLFIFCSGYFACKNNKKILHNLIFPYILFQCLYILFERYILHNDVTFTFTTPYWILWYLLSVSSFNIIIQFFEKINIKVIFISFIIGLAVGYDNSIGHYLSLSRTISLFPFFLLGYYFRISRFDFNKLKKNNNIVYISVFLTFIFTILIYLFCNSIDKNWLFGSNPYEAFNYNFIIRCASYIVAIIFSVFILIILPNKNIKFITKAGMNSMSIFLLHGFVIKFLQKYFNFGIFHTNFNIIIAMILITLLVVLIFSSKLISNSLNNVLSVGIAQHK